MAFVPFPGGVVTEIRAVMDNQKIANVLGWNTLVPVGLAHLQAFAFQLANWWGINARPLLPSSYQFAEVYAYRLNVLNGITAVNSTGAGWLGTRAGFPLPNNVTLSMKLNTGSRGRSQTGRLYWGGLTENDVTLNTVGDPLADAITIALENLRQQDPLSFPDTEMTWCVLSRYANKAIRPVGLARVISSITTTDRIVDTQRRRLPGRGK